MVELPKMSLQTYSREYLQAMPQQKKEKLIDRIIQGFLHEIQTAAELGITSYRYIRSYPLDLSDADIVAGFFTRFPGCKVYYEDILVEKGGHTHILKNTIVIDWS